MSAARDIIAALVAAGMDAIDAASLMARAAVEMATGSAQKSSGAARQQRYRERHKASQSVTDVTSDQASQSVTNRNENVTRDAASLSSLLTDEENKHSEKKEKREPKRAMQLPDGWRPDEPSWGESIAVLGTAERAEYELKKFTNHALEKGRTAKNWNAAWRNWAARAVEYAGGRNGQGSDHRTATAGAQQSGSAPVLAGVASAIERRARERSAAGQPGQVSRNPSAAPGDDLELFGTPNGRGPH